MGKAAQTEETGMPDQALVPAWSKEPKGMPDMRRLAKRVVDSVPGVQAAILFGSRARKTARRDSDWDVVLLAPERYKKEVLRTAPRIPAVSYVSLSPQRLRERHSRLGTLERSVANDGILLAGEWITPESQKRPIVSYPRLANWLETSANRIDDAVKRVQIKVVRRGLLPVDNTLCTHTQDAAERLAKAALLHLCIHPARTHGAMELACLLQKKHPNHPWIETIESFNGFSKKRHVADYDIEETENTEESLDRLYRVIKFYEDVLAAIVRKRPGFAGHVLNICEEIEDMVSIYQRDGMSWDKYPDELKQHLLQWKQMATGYLKAKTAGKRSRRNRR